MFRHAILSKIKRMILRLTQDPIDVLDKRLIRGLFIRDIRDFDEEHRKKMNNLSLSSRVSVNNSATVQEYFSRMAGASIVVSQLDEQPSIGTIKYESERMGNKFAGGGGDGGTSLADRVAEREGSRRHSRVKEVIAVGGADVLEEPGGGSVAYKHIERKKRKSLRKTKRESA